MKGIFTTQHWLLAIPGALIIANYLSATQFGYPFLYCWLSPAAAALYMACGMFALSVAALMLGYHLLYGSQLMALKWAAIGVLVIELPSATDYIIRLGASCHG